jgi:hypothetical protein
MIGLGQLCEIRTNFPDADFWIQRKGSDKTVGTPLEHFSKEAIGIKVIRTDILLPRYLYYIFMALHQKGFFRSICVGTLQLQSLRVEDIRRIPIG